MINDDKPMISDRFNIDVLTEYKNKIKIKLIIDSNPLAPSVIFPALIKPTIIIVVNKQTAQIESKLSKEKIGQSRGSISGFKYKPINTIQNDIANLCEDFTLWLKSSARPINPINRAGKVHIWL